MGMEKRKLLLLKYLINHSKEGYIVLDVAKIFSAIRKYKGNFENLKNDVDYLKSLHYIDVKYLDNDSICLSVLDNSRILQANIKNESSTQKKFIFYMSISALLSGVMAFIGAFLANIILGWKYVIKERKSFTKFYFRSN